MHAVTDEQARCERDVHRDVTMDSLDHRQDSTRRVAVCLSGVARNARQNLKFMRAFLHGSGADVFFHFWENPDQELVVRELRPTAHVFESRDKAPPRANPVRPEQFTVPSRLTNIPSMFYSVMRANQLRRAYEEANGFRYDVVVRLRLDFFSVTSLTEVLERLPSDPAAWARVVYVPDMSHAMGLNDQMALGSSDTMDVYASTFERLQTAERENDMYVAEYFLLRHLVREGIRIATFPFEYVLLRADPIATFDLEGRIAETRRAWPFAPLPDIAPENVEAYLLASADSYKLVDELGLETPKAFRIRSADDRYLAFDAASKSLAFAPDAGAASAFVVVVANDSDRRAVNIRPRQLALGIRQAESTAGYNLRPDASGVVRGDGGWDQDSAFFLARAGDGFSFEWRAGFWRSPWSGPDPDRLPGGREHNPAPPSRPRERLFLEATSEGLRLAPERGAATTFSMEYVRDAEVESSAHGILGSVSVGPPRDGDPVLGRLLWLGYLGVRTIEERGPRVVLNQAVAFVRRRVTREPAPPQPPRRPPVERPRRHRI